MIEPIIGKPIPPRFPSDGKPFGKPTIYIVGDNGNVAQINVRKGQSVLVCVTSKEGHKLDKMA